MPSLALPTVFTTSPITAGLRAMAHPAVRIAAKAFRMAVTAEMQITLAVLRPARRATVATQVTQAAGTAVAGEIDASGAQVFKAHWLSLER